MPEESPHRSMRSRVRLYTFVVLLACLTSCSIVCFSLAIMDDVFVYAGIVCLIGVVLLIAAHFVYRRCSSSSRDRRRADGRAQVARRRRNPSWDLRAIETDVADLRGEVDRVQGTALCSLEAVGSLRDGVEAESERLALWIEGGKVPERSEVQDLVERLDDIRIQLRSIRRRSDRITSALQVHSPFVSTLSYNDHFPLPPSYEDAQRHLPNERHTNATSFALSASGLPSYSSSSTTQLTPSSAPSVDDYAPPPYDEAAGAPH